MKDPRIKEYFAPVRVLASEGVQNTQALLNAMTEPQASLSPAKRMATVSGKGYVLLDFGRELPGGIRILTFLAEGSVHIRFGESASEACSRLGEKGSSNDHALRDFTVHLTSFSDTEWGCTGYRFVRLDFETERTVALTGIYGTYLHRDIAPKGYFECDDERVNAIWNTAVHTLHLNMQTMLWDGIKRDRLVWVGDIYPEMLAVCDVYGKDPCVNRSLEFVRVNSGSDWMNGIPSYSAWWILNACEYALRTGDEGYLSEHVGDINAMLERFCGCIRDGKIVFGSDEMAYFFDWPTHSAADEQEGVYSLLLFTAKKARAALARLNTDCSVAARLERLLNAVPSHTDFKQVLAMQYLSGRSPNGAGERLGQGGAKGVSSFQSYFILRATARSAGTDKAFAVMKEFYGGMLDMGATSFWEDFDVDWLRGAVCPVDRLPELGEKDIHGDFGKYCYAGFRHSLCHGWSAGAIPFLIETVAGVMRKSAREICFTPQPCSLRYLRAGVPVGDGLFECGWKDGKAKIWNLPPNITVTNG